MLPSGRSCLLCRFSRLLVCELLNIQDLESRTCNARARVHAASYVHLFGDLLLVSFGTLVEAAFNWLELEHMLLDQGAKKKDKQAPTHVCLESVCICVYIYICSINTCMRTYLCMHLFR